MRFLYIGFSRSNSIDTVYTKGLRECGHEVDEFFFPESSWKRYIEIAKIFFRFRKKVDFVGVGYASPQAVIWLWLLGAKKIIYNALCSEYERKIISRGLAAPSSIKAFYYWLLDYLACFGASLVMLETQHQIDYFVKAFHLRAQKCLLAWTGVDDRKFHIAPEILKFEQFTILFRGRFLPEAGVEVAVKAAKELEALPINFLILGAGQELPKVQRLIEELKPAHLTLRTDFLSDEELLETMQRCHVSLGQLGDHDRLTRTIPHKAYESIALTLPYLTARNPGVMELFEDGVTCIAFTPADSHDLAEKIKWAYENQSKLTQIAGNAFAIYQKRLTTEALAQRLVERLAIL